MKGLAHINGWVLLAAGLLVFAYDAFVILRFGFDVNDVCGITDEGGRMGSR